ncbi:MULTISPECIES: NIPSNAP family protein [unclassified Rhizobium]|uniref:NIPSNAP family protein n=1 Tax=unclassified Rhizobium TaxID=2613769 RepID=UPI000BE9942C|nr:MULTISPECIES: NIPSNAP family protein [unclassified Rhizobium]MDF0661654.1 NIPSNAP family protein [Rhizobium sp. BC49]PDS87538.1 NIPSNAP family protein [Rhizobium sp. L18]
MILEERDYRIRAGYVADFLEKYQTLGLQVQREHLGEPHGFFVSDIGELNRVVSMWRYADMTERAERRSKMLTDHRWPGYLASIKGLIDVQTIRILTPTAFSPLR